MLLTLLNGAFAMSELALTASRKEPSALAEAGDKAQALTLLENPTQFLSSVKVGITSIGVLNGIIGEAAFSSGVSEWIQTFGLSTRVADVSATALVVTAITFVTIVFGELEPKRIGQLYPEDVARWVSRPMTWATVPNHSSVCCPCAPMAPQTAASTRRVTAWHRGRNRRQPGGGWMPDSLRSMSTRWCLMCFT